jgi:phosphoglycerate dehydrogenase-like enzyme
MDGGIAMAVTGRVLVPWKEIREAVADLGLGVEIFTGEAPGPADLDDVAFFTVPYDQPYGAEPIARMPHVQVVQALTAGYDNLLPLLPDGAALCNARGLHDASTAELALALILAAQRELPRWIRAQDRRQWDHAHTRSLAGSRVVIVGYGSIGAALGTRLRACEADVVSVARRPRPGEGVHGAEELDALLPSADIVVLVTPLTPDTAGLMDTRRLALLPDGALVANVGRGPVLDTGAMLAEAGAGRLRAALDVTDPEPLPADHPLWACPNVIITPHVAGGAAAFYPDAARFVADQIRRFAAGEPLVNVIVPGNAGR